MSEYSKNIVISYFLLYLDILLLFIYFKFQTIQFLQYV